MRALIIFILALPTFALAQISPLNDTGLDQAYDSGGLFPCNTYNTGDGTNYPRQDCRFGRDAQASAERLTKIGGGAAGFDFTPLDANGNPISVVNGKPASMPTCVRDNVTDLIWEVKTDDAGPRGRNYRYTWYSSDSLINGGTPGTQAINNGACGGVNCDTESFVAWANANSLCGKTNWRLPARRELLNIIHNGKTTGSIAIDMDYFAYNGTDSPVWWSGYMGAPGGYMETAYATSETYRSNPIYAWAVNTRGSTTQQNKILVFTGGCYGCGYGIQALPLFVRLVSVVQ